ncbi:MAG: adenylate/guanylate cyclase domain-containing protein, partial [Bacteroidota bacterium]
GVMALFIKEGHQQQALQAAEGIQEILTTYNTEREAKGRALIRMGIGIHTGPLMMGIIGDTLRMEAGVVSDTVNTAARMEGLTKYFGTHIVLSETVFQGLTELQQKPLRYLGQVLVKGRRKPTHIYASLAGFGQDMLQRYEQTHADFVRALQAYHQGKFAESLHLLDKILDVHPTDKAARYYHTCAKHYLTEGPPEDWQGVETMLGK